MKNFISFRHLIQTFWMEWNRQQEDGSEQRLGQSFFNNDEHITEAHEWLMTRYYQQAYNPSTENK